MYRVNPFTYIVEGMLSVGLANAPVRCAENELLSFQPSNGTTCASYMQQYMNTRGGYLTNPSVTADCSFCTYDNMNVFLTAVDVDWDNRWRNFGILWSYVVFNIAGAAFLYRILRVPKSKRKEKKGSSIDLYTL